MLQMLLRLPILSVQLLTLDDRQSLSHVVMHYHIFCCMKPQMKMMYVLLQSTFKMGTCRITCDLNIANALANPSCGIDYLSLMHNMHCMRSCTEDR